MSAGTISYDNGYTAKDKADQLLNGDAAINKIKLDSSVILCSGGSALDFETAFKTLYDDTTEKLESIISRMGTALTNMENADNQMESDTKAGLVAMLME